MNKEFFDKIKDMLDSEMEDSNYFIILMGEDGVGTLSDMSKEDMVAAFYFLAKQSDMFNALIEAIHFQLEKDKSSQFRLAAPLNKDIN